MWRLGVPFEEAAIQQLFNLALMPFLHRHVAAMPDTHFGMGAAIGSVFGSVGAVIPAAVGVDIGCGMIAARTTLTAEQLRPHLSGIRREIERLIPMGRTKNGGRGDRGAWESIPEDVAENWAGQLEDEFREIAGRYPEIGKGNKQNHLGTLGTGNHFIEIQVDEAERGWIMLHSGSRGVGNRIGSYFIRRAKAEMERRSMRLADKDLAYLEAGGKLYDDYVQALQWAQKFAFINRQIMLRRTETALRSTVAQDFGIEEEINTHHNYAVMEHHFGKDVLLTRKGAIRARQGDMGIIPGSMGSRSYIVRGKGSTASFHSCSHGAGRAMSRTEAKRKFTVTDHEEATAGVECRKDADVIDETPMAYKNIDAVIAAESDLVEVVHTLKQVVCCKG